MQSSGSAAPPPERRSFLVRAAAFLAGAVVAIFPFLAGLGVVLNPVLRRRGSGGPSEEDSGGPQAAPPEGGQWVRIGSLDLVPPDGVPHRFAAIANVRDAWTYSPNERIGAVYLVRSAAGELPTAFTEVCPHLGCAVEYDAAVRQFICPCHVSAFAPDGDYLFGPSRRGLDPLQVELVDTDEGQDIWVAYQSFRAGIAKRIPT